MSNLTGYYELSLWEDILQENGSFKEQRLMVIGSSEMESQNKVVEPKLTININGNNTLNFKLYYRYMDNISGKMIDNIFTKHITNESKLKLNHNGKWYDFIIKSISENSTDYSFTYSAVDYHINELSKNGFGLTLSTELENNIDTVPKLADTILKDTDWTVDPESEVIPQLLEEALVEISAEGELNISGVYLLDEDKITKPKPKPESEPEPEPEPSNITLKAGSKIYVFYSCLKNESKRLQFIYGTNLQTDQNRVIQTKRCQYYIDNITYAVQEDYAKLGLKQPILFANKALSTDIKISTEYRAKRYVFGEKTVYNAVLDKYVTEFKQPIEGGTLTWHMFKETKYEAPILIQNLVTNTDFKNSIGWTGQYITNAPSLYNDQKDYGAKVTTDVYSVKTTHTLQDDLLSGDYKSENEYIPFIAAKMPSDSTLSNNGFVKSTLVNSGFYDSRKIIGNISPGQRFVLLYKQIPKAANAAEDLNFTVEVGTKTYLTSGNCYTVDTNKDFTYLTFSTRKEEGKLEDGSVRYVSNIKEFPSNRNKKYEGYYYTEATVVGDQMTDVEFLSKKLQIFITLNSGPNDDPLKVTPTVGATLTFSDFQIFPYVDNGNNSFMLPEDAPSEAKITDEYYYFLVDDDSNENNSEVKTNTTATSREGMYLIKRNTPMEGLQNSYLAGAEKQISVEIKQSNYFNAIQSLCEAAQCWAEFNIDREENGEIKSKKVTFRNYIGQDNYIGFKYGVNLKQITRQINSNTIVTKLIVTDNTNEHANNGFCTIARAGSNETGETYLYNFSNYFKNGMLNYTNFVNTVYSLEKAKGEDIEYEKWVNSAELQTEYADFKKYYASLTDKTTNHYGYYVRLAKLNQQLDNISETLASYSIPLIEAQSKLTIAKEGLMAAEESFKDAQSTFLQLAGFEYNNIQIYDDNGELNQTKTEARKNIVKNNDTLQKCFTEISTYLQSIKDFTAQKELAENSVTKYESENERLLLLQKEVLERKKKLNYAFYKNYARFIQEGTWQDEAEIDDEKYFINAQSVSHTSSKPQVTYTINVIELAGIPEYKDFTFQLADNTWIEDTEFFGYDNQKNPYREEITITEITYSLDNPSDTSVKVQNFKNQFQDLFQRITAQVQQATYSSGAWDNAAKFVEATPEKQAQFLEEVFKQADLVIQNAGNQSVVSDINGITITDMNTPSQQLRLTGGAILLSDMDEGGERHWKVGLTAKGISANIINTGVLNTEVLQIMASNAPTFRWDKYGLTAYGYTTNKANNIEEILEYNFGQGVRYDRFGIYGFKGDTEWHPQNLEDVKSKAAFALTWDGISLRLNQGIYNKVRDYDPTKKAYTDDIIYGPLTHSNQAVIGYTDGYIYNSWVTNKEDTNLYGMPYYDVSEDAEDKARFTKIFSVGTLVGDDNKLDETLVIYDDGTLVAKKVKLTGSVEWSAMSSPSKNIYAKHQYVNKFQSIIESLPENNTPYNSFEDNDDKTNLRWHKIADQNDSYYAHTDDGGATWQGPFLITGRGIQTTKIAYAKALAGTSPEDIPEDDWEDSKPALNTLKVGWNIYIRYTDIFTDGSESDPRYDIEIGRTGYVTLTNYAAFIPTGANKKIENIDILKQLTTVQVKVYADDDLTEGNEITDDVRYKWSIIGGTIANDDSTDGVPTNEWTSISKVYLSSFADNADTATISVSVVIGSMALGTKTCIITKSVQGEEGVQCYISSSEGVAFEDKELVAGTTTLMAHLMRAGVDIDPQGDKFKYFWYIESGETDEQIEGVENKKSIIVSKNSIVNKQIYFIAEEIEQDTKTS